MSTTDSNIPTRGDVVQVNLPTRDGEDRTLTATVMEVSPYTQQVRVLIHDVDAFEDDHHRSVTNPGRWHGTTSVPQSNLIEWGTA